MANPISTILTPPGTTVQTTADGDRPGDWLRRHWVELKADPDLPQASKLTSTWTDAGGQESLETTRLPGETDAELAARHLGDVAVEWLNSPPVP